MNLDTSLVSEIIAAVSALGLAGFGVWKGYIKLLTIRQKSSKDPFPMHFKAVSEVLFILRQLVESGNAQRAAILIMENGGGIPSLRSPIYSSVLYEHAKDGIPDAHHIWQRRHVDAQYLENMRKVHHAEGRPYVFAAEDFNGSDLEMVYEATGIKSSQIAEIKSLPTGYIYISINYDKKYGELTTEERLLGMQAISSLQDIFKKF